MVITSRLSSAALHRAAIVQLGISHQQIFLSGKTSTISNFVTWVKVIARPNADLFWWSLKLHISRVMIIMLIQNSARFPTTSNIRLFRVSQLKYRNALLSISAGLHKHILYIHCAGRVSASNNLRPVCLPVDVNLKNPAIWGLTLVD